MIDFSQAYLVSLSIHHVGNKNNEQALVLTQDEIFLDDLMKEKLGPVFLSKFKSLEETYRFHHSHEIADNSVYAQVDEIFNGQISVHEASLFIAKQLYDVTLHPNIKSGEFYLAHFANCRINSQFVDAVGIYKTEHRSPYFDVHTDQPQFEVSLHEGIDHKCIEKACIVLNAEKHLGYTALMVDQQSRQNSGDDAHYWKDHFLGITPAQNEFHQTKQFMQLTKEYIAHHLPEHHDINRADQIDLLNRSLDFLKSKEKFVQEEFEEEVLQEEAVIQTFRKFDLDYRTHHEIEANDEFDISHQAVKKQSRIFKSVLKLDKNFHVYIHGNRDLIEQGVDSDGRKYYKIYYEEES